MTTGAVGCCNRRMPAHERTRRILPKERRLATGAPTPAASGAAHARAAHAADTLATPRAAPAALTTYHEDTRGADRVRVRRYKDVHGRAARRRLDNLLKCGPQLVARSERHGDALGAEERKPPTRSLDPCGGGGGCGGVRCSRTEPPRALIARQRPRLPYFLMRGRTGMALNARAALFGGATAVRRLQGSFALRVLVTYTSPRPVFPPQDRLPERGAGSGLSSRAGGGGGGALASCAFSLALPTPTAFREARVHAAVPPALIARRPQPRGLFLRKITSRDLLSLRARCAPG